MFEFRARTRVRAHRFFGKYFSENDHDQPDPELKRPAVLHRAAGSGTAGAAASAAARGSSKAAARKDTMAPVDHDDHGHVDLIDLTSCTSGSATGASPRATAAATGHATQLPRRPTAMQRKRWTVADELVLVEALKAHGENWLAIHQHFPQLSWGNVAIKDKIRNIRTYQAHSTKNQVRMCARGICMQLADREAGGTGRAGPSPAGRPGIVGIISFYICRAVD